MTPRLRIDPGVSPVPARHKVQAKTRSPQESVPDMKGFRGYCYREPQDGSSTNQPRGSLVSRRPSLGNFVLRKHRRGAHQGRGPGASYLTRVTSTKNLSTGENGQPAGRKKYNVEEKDRRKTRTNSNKAKAQRGRGNKHWHLSFILYFSHWYCTSTRARRLR